MQLIYHQRNLLQQLCQLSDMGSLTHRLLPANVGRLAVNCAIEL